MKTIAVVLCMLAGLLVTGCEHLDTTAPSLGDRVLAGVVTTATGGGPLPEGSEVWIQVVDRGQGVQKGEVLGEETIKNPGRMPVPFRIEFRAEDPVLRGSVEVEARISVRGRLTFMTKTAHPVTLANVDREMTVIVEVPSER
jgi:Uncharacterized protein conserved in bacteria